MRERMQFRITTHSGHDAPPAAVDELLAVLGARRGSGRFYKVGREIRATWGDVESGGRDRPERMELARQQLLELIRAICEAAPALDADWYAVGPTD
jgi:hypothetical protein